METHQKGDFTEAVVIAELKRREIPVSVPFGDNERYDRTRAPEPDAVDLVLVACEALSDVLVVEREAYETTMSFRVEEPAQRHPGTNLVAEYAFDERWPVG